MREFTIFVDESGKFNRTEEPNPLTAPWIVGGIVVGTDRNTADNLFSEMLERILDCVVNEAWFLALIENLPNRTKQVILSRGGSFSWRDLHRTELWAALKGIPQSLQHEAKRGLGQLDLEIVAQACDLPFARAIATVHEGLRLPDEKTNYELQATDFSMICFTELGDLIRMSRQPVHVQYVFSERKQRERLKQEGNRISKEVWRGISRYVANGLASTSALQVITAKDKLVSLDLPEQSAGLKVADFICGVVKNSVLAGRKTDRRLARILKSDVFRLHGSFDDPLIRKMIVSARDGDLSNAIFYGLLMGEKGVPSVTDFLERALAGKDAIGPRALLESLIDRLDRYAESTEKRAILTLVLRLEKTLELATSNARNSSNYQLCNHLLYRLRSYVLTWVNHLGEVAEAQRIIAELKDAPITTVVDPSMQSSRFSYEVSRIEAEINSNNFSAVKALADRHWLQVATLIENASDGDPEKLAAGFSSHIAVRAQSVRCRASLLAAISQNDWEAVTLIYTVMQQLLVDQGQSDTLDLEMRCSASPKYPGDRLRLLSLLAQSSEFLLDAEKCKKVISLAFTLLRDTVVWNSPYCHCLLARCLATISVLDREYLKCDEACQALKVIKAKLIDLRQRRMEHPFEMLARECLFLSTDLDLSVADCEEVMSDLAGYLQAGVGSAAVFKHQRNLVARLMKLKAISVKSAVPSWRVELNRAQLERTSRYEAIVTDSDVASFLAARVSTLY